MGEAAVACAAYDEEVKERDRLNKEIKEMSQEKTDMMLRIENEQGDLSQYQQRLAESTEEKNKMEEELLQAQSLLAEKTEIRIGMTEKKKRLEGDLSSYRKDIDDMNMQVQKAENERTARDHQIRNLSDEIAHQDELINKLSKEKKYIQENQSKSSDELNSAEEKMDSYSKVKTKLEVTLDELEDSYEREKKLRLDVEAIVAQLEEEAAVACAAYDEELKERDRLNKEIKEMTQEKTDMMSRIEEEQGDLSEYQKRLADS